MVAFALLLNRLCKFHASFEQRNMVVKGLNHVCNEFIWASRFLFALFLDEKHYI